MCVCWLELQQHDVDDCGRARQRKNTIKNTGTEYLTTDLHHHIHHLHIYESSKLFLLLMEPDRQPLQHLLKLILKIMKHRFSKKRPKYSPTTCHFYAQ